ncbi:MAG: sugar transferase [Butyrivibrio crossotus]|nr:sugar transferase [Butyrivibrio crossotus]
MYKDNSKSIHNFILIVLDFISLAISYFLATYLWFSVIRKNSEIIKSRIVNEIGLVFFSFLVVIFIFNMNRDFLKRSKVEEFLYTIKINLIFLAVASVAMFIGNSKDTSRGAYLIAVAFNAVFMYIFHIIYKSYLINVYAKKKKNTQLFIITISDRAEKTVRRLIDNPDWLNRIHSIAVIDADMVGQEICGIPVSSDAYTMMDYVRTEFIDEVFIDVPYHTGKSTRKYVMDFENMGVVVHLNIDKLEEFEDFNKSLSMLGDIPVVTFANNFYDVNKLMIKRLIDIIGSIVGLAITAVVTVFLAPAILIESRGPLIFKQKRVGKNGRFFYVYKFRSMYKDAEERKKALMEKNEMKGLMFKMTDDPRITKVGKFIRKTSLDELPQFFNILKGDMSLVGTRPPTVDEFKMYESYHKRRLSMKPGLTGMWQVSGRSDIEDFEEVVRLDLEYIDNWSIGLDIKIILKTIGVIFKHKGAR